jgi:hypothetical protein
MPRPDPDRRPTPAGAGRAHLHQASQRAPTPPLARAACAACEPAAGRAAKHDRASRPPRRIAPRVLRDRRVKRGEVRYPVRVDGACRAVDGRADPRSLRSRPVLLRRRRDSPTHGTHAATRNLVNLGAIWYPRARVNQKVDAPGPGRVRTEFSAPTGVSSRGAPTTKHAQEQERAAAWKVAAL